MSQKKNHEQPLTLEIILISAEGLRDTTSLIFSKRLRPFITLSTDPPTSYRSINGDKRSHVYQTRIDNRGGNNPSWGDKFHLPIETTFFSQRYSFVYLQIVSKRPLLGKIQLGWCQIPASDIVEGFRPTGSVRHLSYRVRDRDGTRGHGVVNLSVRLVGQMNFPVTDVCQMAVGIPVTLFPTTGECSAMLHGRLGGGCKEEAKKLTGGVKVPSDVIGPSQRFGANK
ncbi:hypothetical protein HHK36_027779 [Tetracentron sinense]|uniref:C2 domain-containing protein n=1 Tax=Tetracentron sinense TaxID=13715 RepID=A0A834YI35_TETSI|nr:hypothetical protein HHK36_027779 [Tetracentron sinense]